MADDTRQNAKLQPEDLSREALNVNPDNKAFTGRQWQDPKAQPYKPPENANMMAGGTMHTAGGKIPEVNMQSAIGSIKAEEFYEVHKKPCVRPALMTGIGAGFGLGGLRMILGGRVWTACNWAVGTFVLGSVGQYQYCQYRRHAEREGMLRAVEILNRKEVERQAREARKEHVKTERRKVKEAEQDAQFKTLKETDEGQTRKSSWKWW